MCVGPSSHTLILSASFHTYKLDIIEKCAQFSIFVVYYYIPLIDHASESVVILAASSSQRAMSLNIALSMFPRDCALESLT